MSGKVMIIAPFWGHPPHLGIIRVDRFVRWLSAQEVQIVVVRAGLADEEKETAWGREITIRDPLGKWGRPTEAGSGESRPAKTSRLRTSITNLIFNPDMTIMWGRSLLRHPLVEKHGSDLDCVLASSPPESAQWAAWKLAKKFDTALTVDMRDGWLDEPLKLTLWHSRFHRWREGRLERRILKDADRIIIATNGLKNMMENRLPFTRGKVALLTNGYPPDVKAEVGEKPRSSDEPRIRLLYAGRFTGSRNTYKPHLLIDPLLAGIRAQDAQGEICLMGDFNLEEQTYLTDKRPGFEAAGWTLEMKPRVPREEAMAKMAESDGLLFLTGTAVVLSAKLFEYLATGRPILAVVPEGGDVWEVCGDLPQVFLIPTDAPSSAADTVCAFLTACSKTTWPYTIPDRFTESYLSSVFLQAIGMSDAPDA